MSSSILEAKLVPDPYLRRIVILAGFCLLLAGCGIWFLIPMDPQWRGCLIVLWVLHVGRELRLMWLGQQRVRALILDQTGQVTGCGVDGGRDALQLLSGSIVRRDYAWLRLRFPDSQQYGELLLGRRTPTDREWHRFQLLWEQSGAAFGRSTDP